MSDTGEGVASLILWQLQQYQLVIRKWQPYLSSNEFAIVMQILDRTIGWQKATATFRGSKLHGGDRMYGGLEHAMARSTMMKALRVLEDGGLITRRRDEHRPWLRDYGVELDWVPRADWRVEIEASHQNGSVSQTDSDVRVPDNAVSSGDHGVSGGDPREEYQDNPIKEHNLDDTHRAYPPPSVPGTRSLRPLEIEVEKEEEGSPPGKQRVVSVNPPPRVRPAAPIAPFAHEE